MSRQGSMCRIDCFGKANTLYRSLSFHATVKGAERKSCFSSAIAFAWNDWLLNPVIELDNDDNPIVENRGRIGANLQLPPMFEKSQYERTPLIWRLLREDSQQPHQR
jgi:hypothetical protein